MISFASASSGMFWSVMSQVEGKLAIEEASCIEIAGSMTVGMALLSSLKSAYTRRNQDYLEIGKLMK